MEVLSGTAKVFWISGADEAVTLLETTGTYSDTITLPDGGNYIGIECEDFTGKIEMNINDTLPDDGKEKKPSYRQIRFSCAFEAVALIFRAAASFCLFLNQR